MVLAESKKQSAREVSLLLHVQATNKVRACLFECVMCVCMFAKETCLYCYGETFANEISARVITTFGLSLEIILGKSSLNEVQIAD